MTSDRERGGWRTTLGGVSIVLAWVLVGCFDFDTSPVRQPCIEGSIVICTCADRSAGTTRCLADGAVGACRCEDGGASDAPAGEGGAGGTTAGTGSPSGGAGGVSGAGGTSGAGGAGGTAAVGATDAGTVTPEAGMDAAVVVPIDAGTPPAPPDDLHRPCVTDGDCGGDLFCLPLDTGMGQSGYCTETCMVRADCTQPSTGNAPSECLGGQCLIQCGLATTCPTGMACLVIPPIINAGFCYY